jgi:hypothetical protein
MYALMIAMNICSNGKSVSSQTMVDLQRRYLRDASDPLSQLQYHRALWRLRDYERYQYTLSRRCFALAEPDLKVRVEAGKLAAVFCFPEGRELSSAPPEALCIEGYFEQIDRALRTDAASVRVEYEPASGYPLTIATTTVDSNAVIKSLTA